MRKIGTLRSLAKRRKSPEQSRTWLMLPGAPFLVSALAYCISLWAISGVTVPKALEREDAVAHFRRILGATDPVEAEAGTIRKLYAESKGKNAVHGSDSPENGMREVAFFFTESEIAGLWG